MSSNYSGRTTPHSDVTTTTQTRNKEKPSRPTSSKASTKSTPYHSSEISNRSRKKHHRRTFYTNCYHLGHWKKDCCFYQCPHCHLYQPHHEEHLCLLRSLGPYGRPKTPIKQESPSPPPLPVHIPYQRGFKTKKPASPLTSPTTSSSSNGGIKKNKGKGKKKNYYTRKQRKVERDIDRAFDEIEREWIEEWRNSPNNKMNPTSMTMKPSTISTRNHLDFRSSWKFRTINGG